MVDGREDGLHATRDDVRRSKIGPAFKISLYKELQRMMTGNPFMEKRRKVKKANAWEAVVTTLRSVKNLTCQGSLGEKKFNVSIPERVEGLKTNDGRGCRGVPPSQEESLRFVQYRLKFHFYMNHLRPMYVNESA